MKARIRPPQGTSASWRNMSRDFDGPSAILERMSTASALFSKTNVCSLPRRRRVSWRRVQSRGGNPGATGTAQTNRACRKQLVCGTGCQATKKPLNIFQRLTAIVTASQSLVATNGCQDNRKRTVRNFARPSRRHKRLLDKPTDETHHHRSPWARP